MRYLNRIIEHIKYKVRNRELMKQGVVFGENCEFDLDVFWGSEPYLIRIGKHVRITKGCKFITHDGGVWVLRELDPCLNEVDLFGEIVIGNNVHIGMDTIIMPGVHIGNNVVVGCGAVITKDIPDNEIWAGVPAKKLSDLTEYCEKHVGDFEYIKDKTADEKKKYLRDRYYFD